jgi:peptidoglycan/xylan/chitin deacetylase (PgdA/CDA1 family)
MSIVLNFHDVRDPEWFENIVRDLKKDYDTVSLRELTDLQDKGKDQKSIAHITVDDGDKTFYNIIYPVLKKNSIPATIFVSPDIVVNQVNFWFQEIIGYDESKLLDICSEVMNVNINDLKKFPLIHIFKCLKVDLIWDIINMYQKKYQTEKKQCQNMGIDELKEVEESGFITIGAHTMRHPILANEDPERSQIEITSSFKGLSGILGREINCFAYPNGEPGFDFTQREIDFLKAVGCQHAFSTESGNFDSNSNLYSIPRYGVSSGDGYSYIKLKLIAKSNWNKIMRLKPANEFSNRKTLSKLMNN